MNSIITYNLHFAYVLYKHTDKPSLRSKILLLIVKMINLLIISGHYSIKGKAHNKFCSTNSKVYIKLIDLSFWIFLLKFGSLRIQSLKIEEQIIKRTGL